MSQAYSGVTADVLVAGADVDAQGWSADYEVNTFDSTTTADGGWDDTTQATQKLGGSFDFFYNSSKTPFGTLSVIPGTIAAMKLYVSLTDAKYLAGNGLITKVSLKSKVKDGFMLTASFVNKGVWTLPS